MSEATLTPTPAAAPGTTEPRLGTWDEIAAAGGTEPWIEDELRRRDLWVESADTSGMSDKQRKQLKAKYEELRRVRKILYTHAWQAYREAHVVHLGAGVFYHDTVDVDRYDVEDPEARLADNDLPKLKDARHLAETLGMSVARLRWLTFHRDVDTGTHYHRWTVPKRSGGTRLISAPKPALKLAQSWIARAITEHLPVHGAAHGFLAGRGTLSNARVHAGARLIVKFDLRNFYPTVTMPRVKGLFRKAGYNEQVATVLAMLVTEAPREELVLRGKPRYVAIGPRSLPQGAPTSPSITNTLCRRLDARLTGLAKTFGFRYTRYADDLTFSWHFDGNKKKINPPIGILIRSVISIVNSEGFRVHNKKTRVQRIGGRQKVTGLVVNKTPDTHPRVPRTTIRNLRAAIHNREKGKPGKGETIEQLRGMAAYVYMADPVRGRLLLDRINKLEPEG